MIKTENNVFSLETENTSYLFRVTSRGHLEHIYYVNRHFSMKDGSERYTVSGEGLRHGIPLAMQYSGTGYHPPLRILGDFGSTLYLIQKNENEKRNQQSWINKCNATRSASASAP